MKSNFFIHTSNPLKHSVPPDHRRQIRIQRQQRAVFAQPVVHAHGERQARRVKLLEGMRPKRALDGLGREQSAQAYGVLHIQDGAAAVSVAHCVFSKAVDFI